MSSSRSSRRRAHTQIANNNVQQLAENGRLKPLLTHLLEGIGTYI